MNQCCSLALYQFVSLEDLGLLLSGKLILMEKDLKYYWEKTCAKCSYSHLSLSSLYEILKALHAYQQALTKHALLSSFIVSSFSVPLGFCSCHLLIILQTTEATILKLVLLHKFWLYKHHFCTSHMLLKIIRLSGVCHLKPQNLGYSLIKQLRSLFC